ncbi:hypothetical protein [Martelella sp. HB161492]|uniref:hypothetical protein n=1 Tax=Martelella sp. HB161492 TaxID=2720726 RepID=UPI001590D486|nr:hypothetical protein [Martelella sp. HB161492]
MKTYYNRAVAVVSEQLRASREKGIGGRILIGAGCSMSGGIPSAAQLVDIIAKRFPAAVKSIDTSRFDAYPDVMESIPENTRRDLILESVSNKPIGWGYVALARLMEEGYIECALSLNFDTQLQKACSLVDFHPSIYDFSTSPHADLSRIVLPSIIHLHGQSYGYIHRHTKSETAPHLKRLDPLIKDSLNRSPLLIIGYSGVADELLKLFEKNQKGRNSLFWLSTELSVPQHLRNLFKRKQTHFLASLKFDAFMVELCKELGCWPPIMLADPPKFSMRLVNNLASFRSSGVQTEVDLKDFVKERLNGSFGGGATFNEELQVFENHIINLDFKGAIKLAATPKCNAAITNSNLHKKLYSWALAEESHNLWCNILENRETLSIREKVNILDKMDFYIEESVRIRPISENIKNKIICLSLRYNIEGDFSLLMEAISFYEDNGIQSENALIHYNVLAVYSAIAAKVGADKKTVSDVEEIWERLRKLDDKLVYNYLCFLSASQQIARAKELFENSLPKGLLPSPEYMKNDTELSNISREKWFVDGVAAL